MPAKPRFFIHASVNESEYATVEAARILEGVTMYEFVRRAVLDRARQLLAGSRK